MRPLDCREASFLAALHAPLEPIVRDVIARAGWRPGGLMLDVACGAGLKHELLLATVEPRGRVVGIDIDRPALRVAREQYADSASAWVAGDASSLPIRDSCVDGVACIAALGAFTDEIVALRELRRVLVAGGRALVVTGAQCWSAVQSWPPVIAAVLARAHRQALDAGRLAPPNELGDSLASFMRTAGFTSVTTRAFLLDPRYADPIQAELAVAEWSRLRPYLAPYLSPNELAHADSMAVAPEDVELVSVLLAGLGKSEPKPYLP